MAALGTETTTGLQKTAQDKIVKSLGELAGSIASRFCCGSTLSSPDQVELVYKKSSGDWSSAAFPAAEQTAVQQLLDVCSIASFGVGGEEVTDRSYRDAFKLDPDRFMTSFQLCDTPILGEIQKLMMPDVDVRGSIIRAELYKLNIYAGPGGHFKAHVDTPRSDQMFGSLVVCLPIQFAGGALVTRHQGREVRFDWSSSPQNPMQKVCWAAFFSDVEHEVLPVTDGYRLTLTYNLYHANKQQDAMPPTLDITTSPFYHELRAAVGNPHFMRDGGVLGFSCQHAYVFKYLGLLKGADHIIYVAAKSLGLPVIVKSVSDRQPHGSIDRSVAFDEQASYILSPFSRFKVTDCCDDTYDFAEIMKDLFGVVHHDKNITWCQKLTDWQPAGAYPSYGNQPAVGAIYQAAAILVGVPRWGKRQTLGTKSTDVRLQQGTYYDFLGGDMKELLLGD